MLYGKVATALGTTESGFQTRHSLVQVRRSINAILRCLDEYGESAMDRSTLAAIYFNRLSVTKKAFILQFASSLSPSGRLRTPRSLLKGGIDAIKAELTELAVPLDKLREKDLAEFKIKGDERTKRENLVIWYHLYEDAERVSQLLVTRGRSPADKHEILEALKALIESVNSTFARLGEHSRLRSMLEQIQAQFCFYIPGENIIVFEGIRAPLADLSAATETVIDMEETVAVAPPVTTPIATSTVVSPPAFDKEAYLNSAEPNSIAAACKVFFDEATLASLTAHTEITAEDYVEKLKKEYRKLSLKYHPDKNPGHEVAFKKVNDLNAILGECLAMGALQAIYHYETMMQPQLPSLQAELEAGHASFLAEFERRKTREINILARNLHQFTFLPKAQRESFPAEYDAQRENIKAFADFLSEAPAFYRNMENRYFAICEAFEDILSKLGPEGSDFEIYLRDFNIEIKEFDTLLTRMASEFNNAQNSMQRLIAWGEPPVEKVTASEAAPHAEKAATIKLGAPAGSSMLERRRASSTTSGTSADSTASASAAGAFAFKGAHTGAGDSFAREARAPGSE